MLHTYGCRASSLFDVHAIDMYSRHYALRLQAECMLIVPRPMVDAVRILQNCSMALGYRCASCEDNLITYVIQNAVCCG